MRSEFNFENKIFLQTSLIVTGFALVSGTIDLILGLELAIVLITYFVALLTFGLYLLSKNPSYLLSTKYILSIMFLVLTNAAWYYNYASEGPVIGIFIVLVMFFTFVWDKKRMVIFNGLILINIISLFFIEKAFEHQMTHYKSLNAKMIDLYVGYLFYGIIMIFFGWYAKNNYLKKYREALETEELKKRFLQNISHDLKTPINSILGFTQLFKDQHTSQQSKDNALKYVEYTGNYMLALINDLVDVTQIDNKKLELIPSEFDLNNLLSELKNEIQIIIPPRQQVTLINQNEFDTTPYTICTDQVKLKRILTNLLNNAIKFTKSGTVTFGYTKRDNNDTEFFVKDTGKGIGISDQQVIFERFAQIQDNPGAMSAGIGLGLSICKTYVDFLGGKIWVESEPGKGSTFRFTTKNLSPNSETSN